MKKSNKLLLGGFLTLLLFITAIHLSLYAKYKAGNYTVFHAEEELGSLPMQQFPNILFISVRNVPEAIVRFSDVTKVGKDTDDNLQIVQKGDTLQITGRGAQQELEPPTTIYLPHNATLSVYHSSLSFMAGKKTIQNTATIYLQTSNAIFHGKESPLQLGRLQLVASDRSQVMFLGNTQVGQLDVRLSNSEIETTEGNFGQLNIVTDSLSRISLPAKQLLKANIRTTTPE